jgi:hypothetical protein
VALGRRVSLRSHWAAGRPSLQEVVGPLGGRHWRGTQGEDSILNAQFSGDKAENSERRTPNVQWRSSEGNRGPINGQAPFCLFDADAEDVVGTLLRFYGAGRGSVTNTPWEYVSLSVSLVAWA